MDLKGVTSDVVLDRFSGEDWGRTSVHVPSEMALTIYVNNRELVTILCTPGKLNCLVLGFLYNEGIISAIADVSSMRVCEDRTIAEVKLSDPDYELPRTRTLTSGCGGGATFISQGQEINSTFCTTADEVLLLMRSLKKQMLLYRMCGGVHTSALSEGRKMLVVAEDIGRHNTLDKIQGECLIRGLSTRDRLLLSTGRISSEILLKAARMQVPIVVSRHSPTGRAVTLAAELGITLVGYARGSKLSVYSHPERLGLDGSLE